MELFVRKFEELTGPELYEILKLRVDVFVVEQKCPYQELDGKDQSALHIFLRDEAGIAAYLRVLAPGGSFAEASIGRVIAVRRRCGLGTRILRAGICAARDIFHAAAIRIEAQSYAKVFYEKQGFYQVSEEFLEDGIPHIQMLMEF